MLAIKLAASIPITLVPIRAASTLMIVIQSVSVVTIAGGPAGQIAIGAAVENASAIVISARLVESSA